MDKNLGSALFFMLVSIGLNIDALRCLEGSCGGGKSFAEFGHFLALVAGAIFYGLFMHHDARRVV